MSSSIQDKIYVYIAARGDRGVTTTELATQFLAPSGTRPEVCEKLIRTVLKDEPRVMQRADDQMWVALKPKPEETVPVEYTVIETTVALSGRRPFDVEVAALRLDASGKALASRRSPVKLDPWPPGLILPPHLKGKAGASPTLAELLPKVAEFAKRSTVVTYEVGGFQLAVAQSLTGEIELPPLLSLRRLAKLYVAAEAETAGGLAHALGLPAREPANAGERVRFTAELFAALMAAREKFGLGAPEEWVDLQHPKRQEVDFSPYAFDREFIEGLPDRPGIYIMRDANGMPIYVGKAANLRERVRSYFRARLTRDEKTERILESVYRLDVEETGSDLAAFLAEYSKIQELQPSINVQFDVHDRPAVAKAPNRRLLAVLPAPDPEDAELFLFHGEKAMRRLTISRTAPEQAREPLREFFFGAKPPEPAAPSARGELHIAWSWLERHADDVNGFDVDLAGGLEGSIQLLGRYLKEEEGKVFHV